MATIAEIQKRLDNKTLDPSQLSKQEREAIDSAIDDGILKGLKTDELMFLRGAVAEDIAKQRRFEENPIQEALDERGSFLKGRPGAVIAGDLTGVALGYKMMSGKLFGAAKNGNLWTRGPLTVGRQMDKVGTLLSRGPAPLKLFGGALRLVGKAADLPERVVRSPLGQAEIVSTLTGATGAAAGSITYDAMNEAAGKTIAISLAEGLADLGKNEIDTNLTYNAANEFKDSLIYGGIASAFTPFLTGVLGSVGRAILPTKKGPEMDEMLNYIRENNLPASLVAHIEDKRLGSLAKNFFKTAGVFPGIASLGEAAVRRDEIAGANLFLAQFLNYAPLMKVGALSSSLYNQVAEVYNKRIGLIGAKYAGLDAGIEAAGNPKVIDLQRTKEMSKEFLKDYAGQFPELKGYRYDSDLNFKEVAKVLQGKGDSMYMYYQYLNDIGDIVSPREYVGLRQMLNKALQQTDFQTFQRGAFKIINALEDDWMTFGGKINKGNLLRDESIKETFDKKVAEGGKEAGQRYIDDLITAGQNINNDLIGANKFFNHTINRYTNPRLANKLKKFDKTLFTNKGTFGIVGKEAMERDQLWKELERDVFIHGSPDSVDQMKYLLGAEKKAVADGLQDGPTFENGRAVFEAARARYLWDSLLQSFNKNSGVEGKIYSRIASKPTVAAGRQYATEAFEQLQKEGAEALEEARGFTIKDVQTGNGIYNIKDLRFTGDEVAQFDINTFLNKLGFSGGNDDQVAEKLSKVFSNKKHFNDFMNWTRYMKSTAEVTISDPSTFLMRRFQLGALGAVAGGYLIGSGNEEGLLAPLAFLLLGRKFGQILGDPVAIRHLNDALGVDEKLKLMKGQKIGAGAPPVLPFGGPKKFTAGPGELQKVGIKKRDAFARLFNYMNDQDRDVPRVNANDINPQEITDALLKMSMQIPEPIYDQNTIKSDTYENFYAGEFIEGSGDANEDNDVAAYMDETVNQALVHAQDLEQRDQEANERGLQEGDEPAITSDLQFQQAGTGAQNITPETGQVKSEDVAALFPDDATTIAAARRRESA
jgi:hypothetical protein